jgi:exosortase
VILWIIVFYPLYPELAASWLGDSNNSHGLMVPFISAFFVWQKRRELSVIEPQPDIRGAIILYVSLSIYLLGYTGGVAVVARSMIVVSIIGLVLYNFGVEVFKKLAFALFFLFFMIPIPVSIISLISLPLRRLATDISAFLIRLTSIPTYQEGNMLYFAETQLEVAEACSGINSITAMLMIGTVLVYIKPITRLGQIIILGSTVPIAMLANIVRVTGTGILAHFFGKTVARGFLHEFSGMAVFAFGLVLLLITYKVIEKLQLIEDRKILDIKS